MRYSKRGNHTKNIFAYLIFFLVSIGLVFLGYLFYTKKISKEEIDPRTLCTKNGKYSKHLILIDITDKYNFIQLTSIKHEVESIIKSLDKGEQIQIYLIKDKIDEDIKPSIKICNPGTGNNESFVYSNPKLIKKKWNKQFYTPLKETLTNIESNSELNRSPIFEMIQFVNNIELKSTEKSKTLTIFSDMIQNSSNFSFFKDRIETFFESSTFRKVKTNLSDVYVNIFYIRRDGQEKHQTKKYGNFWIEYFMKMNADVNLVKKLDG